jgi:nitrilase
MCHLVRVEQIMFTKTRPFTAAVVQHPPAFLDLRRSLDRACEHIQQAAATGAELIVFPETWLPGYPIWLDVAPTAALWDHPPAKAVFRTLYNNSVEVPGPAVQRLGEAAKAAGAVVAMGIHERDGGTLYNTTLIIDANGQLRGRHRKLMPTYTERMLWGRGDGSTLNVVDTHLGRVGGLICWEHWMPLARQAMHEQQELVHVAQWPFVKEIHLVASRNYAFEGQCFVVAAGAVLQHKDLEHLDFALFEEIAGEPDRFIMAGGSAIIGPDGNCLAGPLYQKAGIITAEIEPQLAVDGRLALDVTGHYSRPDIFKLRVNTTAQSNVQWQGAAEE